MKLTLTYNQLLQHYKTHRHIITPRTDTTLTRTDGIDTDTLLGHQALNWHHQLLLHAPLEYLTITDLQPLPTPHWDDTQGIAQITLPSNVIRIASIMAKEWHRPAQILTDPNSPLARLQYSPLTRGLQTHPIAIVHHTDTSTPLRLTIFTLPAHRLTLQYIHVILAPTPDQYQLDSTAFQLIQPIQ